MSALNAITSQFSWSLRCIATPQMTCALDARRDCATIGKKVLVWWSLKDCHIMVLFCTEKKCLIDCSTRFFRCWTNGWPHWLSPVMMRFSSKHVFTDRKPQWSVSFVVKWKCCSQQNNHPLLWTRQEDHGGCISTCIFVFAGWCVSVCTLLPMI